MILVSLLSKIIGFPRYCLIQFKLRNLPAKQRELVKKLDMASRSAGDWRLNYETLKSPAAIGIPYFKRRAELFAECREADVPQKLIKYFGDMYR